jgi:hypothetical protein
MVSLVVCTELLLDEIVEVALEPFEDEMPDTELVFGFKPPPPPPQLCNANAATTIKKYEHKEFFLQRISTCPEEMKLYCKVSNRNGDQTFDGRFIQRKVIWLFIFFLGSPSSKQFK